MQCALTTLVTQSISDDKLTKIRRTALQELANGGLMTIDKQNLAHIGSLSVAPVNRYFFTQKRLVTRLDKTKSIEAEGNGYIITDKDRKLIEI